MASPSNEGRGYVLRRLIRRAMVHARRLGPNAHLSSGVPIVVRLLGDVYPEARKQVSQITDVVRSEEERFSIALRQGMEAPQGPVDRKALTAEGVFYLHDTLGFPVELSAELAGDQGVTVDMTPVATLMQGQRDRSRVATGGFTAPLAGRATRFVGYDRLDVGTSLPRVFSVAGGPG